MAEKKKLKQLSNFEIFQELKKEVSLLDCVSFAENHLTIDGKPFNLSSSGWKYMAELYRMISAQVENKNARPIVLLKGRQVGATIMAAVLSLHMTSSGLYGSTAGKPAIRVMHAFPDLKRCSVYAKEILAAMISGANEDYISKRSLKNVRSSAEDTQTEKNFIGNSRIRVDSMGVTGDRIRGSTQDVLMMDECIWSEEYVEVEGGKKKLKTIERDWKKGRSVPRVMSYDVENDKFEYQKITNVWNRGKKKVLLVKMGNREVTCTPNHLFLTSTRGYVEAQNLKKGDLIITNPSTPQYVHGLNDDQLQVALGSFLGDGNLQSHKEGRYRVRVLHGASQEQYLKWKASMFGAAVTYLPAQGTFKVPGYWFASNSFGLEHPLPQTHSSVPQWVIDKIDARAIAVWAMDDGSVSKKTLKDGSVSCSFSLFTNSFDENSQHRLVEKLKSLGIDCKYMKMHKLKGGILKQTADDQFYIAISTKGFIEFEKLISPYFHSNMFYKLNKIPITQYNWNHVFPNYGITVVDEIVSLEKELEVIDIEVEKNHNFIITSGHGSKNLGGVCVHNCQDMAKTAIENTLRVLTASPYGATTQGVQVFFGTPKHAGSYFWQIWQNSDKRFFQLKCQMCDNHFQLYNLENENWNEIWVEGQTVQCPHCGKKQKKQESMDAGYWKATRPFDENGNVPKYIGYHFNMMLSPLYTKEQVLEYWPEHNKNASERAWKNETKGEFFSASATPLTLEEVFTNCMDESRGIAKSIIDPSNRMFFLGMDWGEKVETAKEAESKRGKSYTCAVILSIDTSGTLIVENAVRLRKNDPNYKMQVLKKLMTDFHITQGAADFYYANDFMRLAQINEGLGEKFLSCTNLGSSKKKFSYDEKEFMVSLNKDMLLEELFGLFKRGKIKFPAKGDSQEILMWLIEHCTSMETHVKVKEGVSMRTYQKGTIQNDGLMALMYAYTAYQFHVTKKFSSGGSEAVKKDDKKPLVPVLGHIPRMK